MSRALSAEVAAGSVKEGASKQELRAVPDGNAVGSEIYVRFAATKAL